VNRSIGIQVFLLWLVVFFLIFFWAPSWISDKNAFLSNFVGEDMLDFMGIVVTITLGSASNIFLELNKVEVEFKRSVFRKTKADIQHSAYALIGLLICSFALVCIKPIIPNGEHVCCIINGIGISIILATFFILVDLTQASFSLSIHK
jgi:hypothetical protein